MRMDNGCRILPTTVGTDLSRFYIDDYEVQGSLEIYLNTVTQ